MFVEVGGGAAACVLCTHAVFVEVGGGAAACALCTHAVFVEVGGGSDTGEHQQLGRVQRACGQDHLLPGVDVVPLLVADQLHAVRPLRLRVNQHLTDGTG